MKAFLRWWLTEIYPGVWLNPLTIVSLVAMYSVPFWGIWK